MKILIYLFPAMVNFVISGVFFYVIQRFVDYGASKLLISLAVPMWAVTYCIANVIIAKTVTVKNSAGLIITGGAIIAGASLGFIFLDALPLLLLWTGMLGIGVGFYCSPFQLLCRELEKDNASGIAMATGKYTFAWSTGFAAGAVTFGMLNYLIAFSMCFAVGVSVAAGVAIIKRRLKQMPSTGNDSDASTIPPADMIVGKFPDYAWVGWIVGGIISFAVNQLRSMLQAHGASIEIANSKETMALALMVVSLLQGITALLLAKSRIWMYKIFPMLIIGIIGTVSMAGFCFVRTLPGFLLAAFGYGIYSGCGYFLFVFYALANREKAGSNAAVNEISVSIASIAGPLLGGLLADKTELSWSPFAMAAICIVAATLFHIAVFARDQRRKNTLMEVSK